MHNQLSNKPRLLEEMITMEQVAKVCQVTTRTIRRLVETKQIPHRKLGNSKKPPVRFYPSEIQAWIDKKGVTLELKTQ